MPGPFPGTGPYLVHPEHGTKVPHRLILTQRLPRIHVPPSGSGPDALLDLQAALDRCHDEGAFARKPDYSQPLLPPLEEEDALWTDALLRTKGLKL